MPPSAVSLDNSHQIFKRLHPNSRKPKDCKLKVGDLVRLVIEGHVFTKVYILYERLNFTIIL